MFKVSDSSFHLRNTTIGYLIPICDPMRSASVDDLNSPGLNHITSNLGSIVWWIIGGARVKLSVHSTTTSKSVWEAVAALTQN